MNHPHYFQSVELADLGALRVSGPDAVSFLQGQLSSDLTRLTTERSSLAGYHNPQGRTIALLRLVRLEEGEVLAILPRELAAAVAARLSKHVLRAKVKVADESADWSISGLIAAALEGVDQAGLTRAQALRAASLGPIPCEPDAQRRLGDARMICLAGEPARWLVVRAGQSAARTPEGNGELPDAVSAPRALWRQLDIAAGLPQVYAATSEEFVAQMLNLDVLGAIAFDKGCYTGQEVIARAHYRGRVKRRLQRFRSRTPLELHPGDSGELPDGRGFRVVEAVRLEDGRCEFLAVAPTPGAEPGHSGHPEPLAVLERVMGASATAAAGQGGAAGLAPANVGAPATGAALHAAIAPELTTTGAVWAPFASSPGAPAHPAEPMRPRSPAAELPRELERLELPYALPE
jgi:folate-binding protein YgfZ